MRSGQSQLTAQSLCTAPLLPCSCARVTGSTARASGCLPRFLNCTTHRNLTMPGQQSVSIVFDMVPAGRMDEAERVG